jgi:hypothetical protein
VSSGKDDPTFDTAQAIAVILGNLLKDELKILRPETLVEY